MPLAVVKATPKPIMPSLGFVTAAFFQEAMEDSVVATEVVFSPKAPLSVSASFKPSMDCVPLPALSLPISSVPDIKAE